MVHSHRNVVKPPPEVMIVFCGTLKADFLCNHQKCRKTFGHCQQEQLVDSSCPYSYEMLKTCVK